MTVVVITGRLNEGESGRGWFLPVVTKDHRSLITQMVLVGFDTPRYEPCSAVYQLHGNESWWAADQPWWEYI